MELCLALEPLAHGLAGVEVYDSDAPVGPPIATPAYRSHLEAIYNGDYPSAKEYAARKLADLSA